MTALLIGSLLAVGALAFVLYPLFFGTTSVRHYAAVAPRMSERDEAVTALREIEFDRATGKLSDTDYAELRARYTQQAVVAMRREANSPVVTAAPSDDEIEVAVSVFRERHPTCPTCGPRPESDAAFCSGCGRYLHDRCAGCGAPVVAHDARYCETCGSPLGA